MKRSFHHIITALATITVAGLLTLTPANAERPAKQVFGTMASAAALRPAAHGFYSKGCLSGGIAMPYDGPTWQVMRISRNRRWGHPDLIKIIEKLSIKANHSGWNGLLVGDISQPRGGPMLTGHRSHQIGLDADIWLTPMPNRRMTFREREETSAVSILKKGTNYVDDRRWNKSFEKLLYHAASFPQVERLLVHPGIKKKLCETVRGDRSWLQKVRPFYGHHYHFHVRIGCPAGSKNCRRQSLTTAGTGCGKSLRWWYEVAFAPKKPSKKKPKPKTKKRKVITLSDLPQSCRHVVQAGNKNRHAAVYNAPSLRGFRAPALKVPKKFHPLSALNSAPIEASAKSNKTARSIVDVSRSIADVISADQRTLYQPLNGYLPIPTPSPIR